MTTVSIHMPEQSGQSGLTLFLRKTSDGTLLNTGGDALSESPASSGRFVATVAETWAETLAAAVRNASSLTVRDGWLASGETIVRDAFPSAGSGGAGDAEQATLLEVQETVDSIATALAGSAPVEPTGITVFELLEGISSQTSQITGSRISTVGPVSAAGDITLILGKDYKVASESELTISVPDTAGALHAEFSSETLAASKAFGMSRSNGDADISGTVSSVTYATNVTTFKVEIDANQLPDTLSLTDDWTYQIERVTSSGDKVVGVQGAGKVAMRAL
jgi:hypothetical protein